MSITHIFKLQNVKTSIPTPLQFVMEKSTNLLFRHTLVELQALQKFEVLEMHSNKTTTGNEREAVQIQTFNIAFSYN